MIHMYAFICIQFLVNYINTISIYYHHQYQYQPISCDTSTTSSSSSGSSSRLVVSSNNGSSTHSLVTCILFYIHI